MKEKGLIFICFLGSAVICSLLNISKKLNGKCVATIVFADQLQVVLQIILVRRFDFSMRLID